ncbi:MAG: hypothetical protein AVDCRST_MAG77-707, partial [uncultured Chloroflexi bacterium]
AVPQPCRRACREGRRWRALDRERRRPDADRGRGQAGHHAAAGDAAV